MFAYGVYPIVVMKVEQTDWKVRHSLFKSNFRIFKVLTDWSPLRKHM
jgi:hypothetical protein